MLEGLYSPGMMWMTSWKESSDIFFWDIIYNVDFMPFLFYTVWNIEQYRGLFRQNYWSDLQTGWSDLSVAKSFSLTTLHIVGYANWGAVADNDKTPRLQGKILPAVGAAYTSWIPPPSKYSLHIFFVCLFVFQPYPMYPATTSLVNVVPKLSSTGRDLLQVWST